VKADGLESDVMRVLEAKDLLVRETAEQARMEGVALSELETRMMYFVENEEMREDPVALNDEFEAEYDADEYEAKMHGLMRRAYARVKKENPEMARQWKEAIREMSKGDHYLPVLWGAGILAANYPTERPPYDFLKQIGTALLVIIIGLGLLAAADHYGIHWDQGRTGDAPRTQTRMPGWLERLLIVAFAGSYIYFAVLPLVTRKSPPGMQRVVDAILRGGTKKG
jgi:hypothetical protein